MRFKPLILTASTMVLLAACEPVEPVAQPEPPTDQCGASRYQGLLGQPRDILASMTFPIGTRMMGPEDAITADYRPERLNIEYGSTGRIEKISCF
jgi:hypothetical protein